MAPRVTQCHLMAPHARSRAFVRFHGLPYGNFMHFLLTRYHTRCPVLHMTSRTFMKPTALIDSFMEAAMGDGD